MVLGIFYWGAIDRCKAIPTQRKLMTNFTLHCRVYKIKKPLKICHRNPIVEKLFCLEAKKCANTNNLRIAMTNFKSNLLGTI